MFYHIITYGCQMNVHESEKLAGILENRGYKNTTDKHKADIIIFNTCCIRDTAEKRALGNISALKSEKKKRPDLIIGVCGCMTQQPQLAEYIREKMPYVDIVFGTHNLHCLDELLERKSKENQRVIDIWGDDKAIIPENTPIYRTSGVNAWVNIMYGCNNFCTYCIVPHVRGRERSRPKDVIIKEVTELVKDGKYPEITLLGQNVNSYGNDIDDENVTFAKLLGDICAIPYNFRLKFMTSHPKDISNEVIDTIAENPKMSKYVHLPIQSGSNNILHKMNRRYTTEYYLSRVEYMRSKIPNLGLSSDIMVGFPGETEQDFQDTLDLVKKVRYNNLYMFIYSPRKGTPAASMPQIDEVVKKERIKELIKVQRQIMTEIAKECVGKTYNVLIEEFADDKLSATTDCGKLIFINGGDASMVGKFAAAKVTQTKSGRLIGELV